MKKRLLFISAIIGFSTLTAFGLRPLLRTASPSGLELARLMPQGALVYIEAPQLTNLFNQWVASTAHARYYESANWKQFQRSRLYLKLRQRLEPIEVALGFEIGEERFGELIGQRSALGIYNIGELQILFVSQMRRDRALGSRLFEQRAAFRERSIDGLLYYLRQGASAESQRTAEAGFAFADGKVFVASSESLLRRALANIKGRSDDRLSHQIAPMIETLDNFTPHDITLWLDQRRLNTNRYFRNYWIHRQAPDLAAITSALIDLDIDGGAFREQRWFELSGTPTTPAPTLASVDEMLRLAPANTQLINIEPVTDIEDVSQLTATLLLGRDPGRSPLPAAGVGYPSRVAPVTTPPSSAGSHRLPVGSRVDRFNKEIDDPTSFSGSLPGGTQPPAAALAAAASLWSRLVNILQPAQPLEFMRLEEATLDENRLFVRNHHALIIKLARPDRFTAQAFQDAIGDEFATRFVVRGVPYHLVWKTTGEVHALSQSMLDRGGAYALLDDVLILANRPDYCRRVVQTVEASGAPTQRRTVPLEHFAQIRIQPGKETYKQVMGMLAIPQPAASSKLMIDLFSDNIASLLDIVPDGTTVTLETWRQSGRLRQWVIYRFD